MKVKIYVNIEEQDSDYYPLVLTEKEYAEKIDKMVAERLKPENLKNDYSFDDFLEDHFSFANLFFLKEETKESLVEDFKQYAIDHAKAELEYIYTEIEKEI